MSFHNALAQMDWHFGIDVESWRETKDGFYSLGSYAFGATIEPRYDKFFVRVGRNIGWGQAPGALLVEVEFDTLDEAMNLGMLIYTQNKRGGTDRTLVKGYPV